MADQFKQLETNFSKLGDEYKELEDYSQNDENKTKIEVDTLRGKKTLTLSNVNENLKSHKKKKFVDNQDPYYYNVMRDIYQIDLDGENQTGDTNQSETIGDKSKPVLADESAFTEEEKNWVRSVGGKELQDNFQMKEINAKDINDFDMAKYQETLERKNEMLSQQKALRPTNAEKEKGQLNAMAHELIVKEFDDNNTGYQEKQASQKRTQNRYGW